ncbi:MAG: TetR/AcrR family transcriptional regulator [Parvularculaceae bacterium]|nr:TetR/AcrR family transcriptional regulator C-terminal domain-containing protein [Parvularculaceae bacterium]
MGRNEDQFERFLKAGEALLIENGFEAFSVDAVARSIGVDAEAVRAEMGEKDDYIALIVRRASSGIAQVITKRDPDLDETPAERLHRIALIYLQAVFTKAGIRIYRIAAHAANEHPHISVQFRASAGEAMKKFADMLENEIGVTVPAGYTYEEAAGQFFALCRGGLHHMTLFDVDYQPSRHAVENAARQGADTFLRAFPIKAR